MKINRLKPSFLWSAAIISIFVLSVVHLNRAQGTSREKSVTSPPYPKQLKSQFVKVRPGDTLISLLEKHGFNNAQRAEILRQKVFDDSFTLVPGEKYKVTTAGGQNFKELKFYAIPSNHVYLFWRKDTSAGSISRIENYNLKIKSVRGRISGSILASINALTKDDFVAQRFMDAYALDYKLTRQVQRGAKFAITFEEKYDGDQFIGTGEVIETELEINGRNDRRQFVQHDDGGSFIAGEYLHRGRPLYSPVNYMRITSHYNPRRIHPITKRRTAHLGVDFELPEGADLFATNSGRVIRVGQNRAAGKYVVLRHGNGMESYYNHMHTIARNLRVGTQVASGQLLGTVGCTGYCTKPHLHFALKKQGRFVDPVPYLKSYPYPHKSLIARHMAALSEENN